ncbi:Hypothetical protein F387_01981 [Wohlfahrtiimonas chitiniclastica SH04]|uniref:Uncharacterized protein n=1 Tax=Wohlfahrtiimonas chitiniclastica SH04 TaxID=1261130 RepID=L8XT40_9GAMM|nr:hypothetical protein [Wohlfahrtiimonas chitiniclastica]ELV07198.1 Hypothetical protein F387_01981 [Wohlfahrtiimonas chitiniclastica SH04]
MKLSPKILMGFLLVVSVNQLSFSTENNFTNIDSHGDTCNYYNLSGFKPFFNKQEPEPIGVANYQGNAVFGINGKKVKFTPNNVETLDALNFVEYQYFQSDTYNLSLEIIGEIRSNEFDSRMEKAIAEDTHPEDIGMLRSDNTMQLTRATLSNKDNVSIHYIGYTCNVFY